MPQLSRPFQIVMVVFVLFAGVWLFVLQGHSTSNSRSTPAVSSTTAAAGTANTHGSASSSSATAGAKSHGSGSSLGSLGHAIAKAHHAAAVSQQNANQLEAKSAAQSNEAAPAKSTAVHAPSKASTHKASAAGSAAAKPAVKPSTSTGESPTHKSSGSAGSASSKLVPSGQRSVEADLAKGNVVVLLFWNPVGTDDALTFRALQPLTKTPKVSIQAAPASAVANYGSITRGVQVYATPTILVINKQGQAIVLTGLQDTYAITQAIGEARSSS